MTIACDLACRHCRADAQPELLEGELSTDDGRRLMDSVKELGSMLVLTGGDPMKRPDLFELIKYGRSIKIPIAITPAVTPLLERSHLERFREAGITALGVSLDGPQPDVHDVFRQVDGTFERSMRVLGWARELEIPVQINTSVTGETIEHLPAMYELLRDHAAPPVKRWSLFLLVPVGRGAELNCPTAERIEELFAWVYSISDDAPFRVGTTEAPHYKRYWIQQKMAAGMPEAVVAKMAPRMAFGIRDGNGVIFVSSLGDVYPAGFLPYPLLGNVRETPLEELYRHAPGLKALRDPDGFHGRCGRCEYRYACGGSRARAYGMTGDELGSDPLCVYEPGASSP
jgi:radical SAM protein